ncbi:MAG: PD40 domain-containing protein [Planctomycetaceae bacterium]|nr:PD40 domain-containing protein [Planctomycetaceae bacterium]
MSQHSSMFWQSCIRGVLLLLLISHAVCSVLAEEETTLVFSVRKWEGEYESRDVPGGVKTTPSTSSIYSIRADGTGLSKLVEIENAVCAAPVFSPDGKWLYFQSNASGNYQLYRCRPDGTKREQLTSDQRPGPPWKTVYGLQMTATGQLLCTVFDGKQGCVAVLSPDGSQMNLVAPHLGYLYMSAMSPRGDALIASGPASGYRLWLMKLPDAFRNGADRLTRPTVNLAPQHPESFAPQFTPDGKTIVYFRRDGDIYRVESDGTGHQRLTTGNQYVEFRLSPEDHHGSTDGPQVSPDGKKVAFIALRGGVPQVCTIDIDGSHLQQLTSRDTACGRVRWSPDGKRIAFVSFVGKYPQLFLIDADGGMPKQLTSVNGAIYFVNWKQQSSK